MTSAETFVISVCYEIMSWSDMPISGKVRVMGRPLIVVIEDDRANA